MNVLLPVVIAGGITALNDVVNRGALRVTVVAGTFVFGLMMFVLETINAELAYAIAWVVAITAVLLNGVPVFQAVTKGVN
jgi:multidrug transporter EmrE-like cation transporter